MGDGQGAGFDPFGRQLRGQCAYRGALAGDDHTGRAIHRGNRHLTRRSTGGNGSLNPRFRGIQGNHLPILRQGPHQATTRRNEFEPIFQAKNTRYTGRDKFTNTVPNQQIRLDPPRLPQLSQRILQHKKRWLGVSGVVKGDA